MRDCRGLRGFYEFFMGLAFPSLPGLIGGEESVLPRLQPLRAHWGPQI